MIPRYDVDDLSDVVAVLEHGDVVALPTDTVYGVAALLSRPAAVAKLFDLKNRPSSVALPILIGSWEQLLALGVVISDRERMVAEAYWPGALTLVLGAPHALATLVGSTDSSVGVRWPHDERLERLLQRSGPLAVTSANQHGAPPCHDADEVLREFGDTTELGALIDGGHRAGLPSTVVRVTPSGYVILRPGPVSDDDLATTLGPSRGPEFEVDDH